MKEDRQKNTNEEQPEVRLEDKHESDLTPKEKRILERRKLKGMGLRKKLEYIWMYYKPAIFGLVLVVILAITGRDWYQNAKMEEILSIYVVNAGMEDQETWPEDVEELLGITDPYEKVNIVTSLNTDETGESFDYYTQMAFVTQVGAQSMDILITTEGMCKQLMENEYFADLSDVLDEETLAAFGDRAEQYYIKLDGSVFQDYVDLAYDPVCVAVMVNAKNLDNAVKWLSSLQ